LETQNAPVEYNF